MNKKYLWIWTIWIGLASGIYCYVYTKFPVASYNVIWMTFVSLPIFFGAGAKIEEFPHYFSSLLSGVAWGVLFLYCIKQLVVNGMDPGVAMLLVVSALTIICVGLHMIILGSSWVGKVPMIFGGLSMTFSQGGQNLTAIIGTLAGGLILGVAISEGGKILEKCLAEKDVSSLSSNNN